MKSALRLAPEREDFTPTPQVESATPEDLKRLEHYQALVEHWQDHPVQFVLQALRAQPDPWQCDVMDVVADPDPEWDNVLIRACHGVGKTTLLAWLILWFTTTHLFARMPTTAPTFNKQVRDVLWAEVHTWFRSLQRWAPALAADFYLTTVRLMSVRYPQTWFAVGIPSAKAVNLEGYHSRWLMAIFDEAKGIMKPTWDAVHGMRTTDRAKLIVASTPGGPMGEFFNAATKYRATWKSVFVIHPFQLRQKIGRPEAPAYSKGGTYYSSRMRSSLIEERRLEWGEDSPIFIARIIGDFPTVEGDELIPYVWLAFAEDREDGGQDGPVVVSCDVARSGRDRTVFLVARGGNYVHGESVAATLAESTSPEAQQVGIGSDPDRPRYRSTDVTADICRRLRKQWSAEFIVVDDTGLGGGVTDYLRRKGERVIPVHFGALPTDKPRDSDEAASRKRRHLIDSGFVSLKAQMAWIVRQAFEDQLIALGNLPDHVLKPLLEQAALMRRGTDIHGRIKVIDPDERRSEQQRDEQMLQAVGMEEGKRSPDHFHALILNWWVASGAYRGQKPKFGPAPLPEGVARLGTPMGPHGTFVAQQRAQPGKVGQRPAAGVGAGQARWIQRWGKHL